MRENDIPLETIGSDRKRVLVVDDEPEILSLMRDVLETDGRFEVATASTGYDAGLETERFKPNLIVLDYMLPDINGNIVCRRVRENGSLEDCKVLCVSGVVESDEVERLRQAGADDFLKKPFDLRELVARIERLLELPVSS